MFKNSREYDRLLLRVLKDPYRRETRVAANHRGALIGIRFDDHGVVVNAIVVVELPGVRNAVRRLAHRTRRVVLRALGLLDERLDPRQGLRACWSR